MPDATRRLRTDPRDRFANPEVCLRLDDEFAQLPKESASRQGHMQKALYRHGNTTTAIFTFDAGSGIDQHAVEGESIIHVIGGKMNVATAEHEYVLGPNDLLLLDPGVPHDLKAIEPSRMLMTFVREQE